MLQCDVLGGRKSLQLKQYFKMTVWPRIVTSLVLGGGLYCGLSGFGGSICLSRSASSAAVPLGSMPGSVKLVLNRVARQKTTITAAMRGMAIVTLFAKYGESKAKNIVLTIRIKKVVK